jgi:hypothetical protein
MGASMRTEFDYETAWEEAAKPAFEALPADTKSLLATVAVVAKGLHQDAACDMVWPSDGGTLRKMFEALGSEQLATASRVAYYYGHWGSGKDTLYDGSTWKLANYADQVLRARLGLVRSSCNERGSVFMCHEGLVRVGVSTADSWMWDEVALATAENVETIRYEVGTIAVPTIARDNRVAWDRYADDVKAVCLKLRARLMPSDPYLTALFDTDRFMVPDGTLRGARPTDHVGVASMGASMRTEYLARLLLVPLTQERLEGYVRRVRS